MCFTDNEWKPWSFIEPVQSLEVILWKIIASESVLQIHTRKPIQWGKKDSVVTEIPFQGKKCYCSV